MFKQFDESSRKEVRIVLRNMERLSEKNYLNLTVTLCVILRISEFTLGWGEVKVFLGASIFPVNFSFPFYGLILNSTFLVVS